MLFAVTSSQAQLKLNISGEPFKMDASFWTGLGLSSAAGYISGAHEIYNIQGRRNFEVKWGVDPYSFFGSKSWMTIYNNNDPAQGYKTRWAAWKGSDDFHHWGKRVRNTFYVGSGICVMIGEKKPWTHYAMRVGVNFLFATAFTRLSYNQYKL